MKFADILMMVVQQSKKPRLQRGNEHDRPWPIRLFGVDMTAVRLALRDLVFADITDAQLESAEDLDDDSSQSSLDLLKPLDEAAEDDLVDPPEPIEDIGIEV